MDRKLYGLNQIISLDTKNQKQMNEQMSLTPYLPKKKSICLVFYALKLVSMVSDNTRMSYSNLPKFTPKTLDFW